MANIRSVQTIPGKSFKDNDLITPDDLNDAIDDIAVLVGENALTARELDPEFIGPYVQVVTGADLAGANSYTWDTSGNPARSSNVLEIWPEQSPFTLSLSDTSNGRSFWAIIRLASGTISLSLPAAYKCKTIGSYGNGHPYTNVANFFIVEFVTHSIVTAELHVVNTIV